MSGILTSDLTDITGTRPPAAMLGRLAQNAINIRLAADGNAAIDAPDETDEEDAGPQPDYLRHDFDANLAEHLTDIELANLSAEIQRGIDADKAERRDWDAQAAEMVKMLGLKFLLESEKDSVGGGSLTKVWDPLILEAAISFWANAVAEFLPADGPCKVRDDKTPDVAVAPIQPGQPPPMGHNGGPPLIDVPPPGGGAVGRDEISEDFEKDMNWYLTAGDRGYYPDFSRMLMSLGPLGTQFRKIFWHPLRRKPVSEWVRANDLIVSSDATSLATAARVTQIIMMSQGDAKRLMKSGWWRKCDLMTPVEQADDFSKEVGDVEGVHRAPTQPADHRHTIQECYLELDLSGFEHTDEDGEQDGLPLPYRVAIDKTSRQIVEIRRNWRQEDELFTARQRFVYFGMIPGMGFYALGFMHILGNGELALTSIGRQLLDAGMFANFPAWFQAKGAGRQVNTDVQLEPGCGAEIDTMGKAIGDIIMQLPFKGPSSTLAELASALTARMQKLAGAADVPVGEGTADVPVGTVIAMVEQSTKMMAAVHKGLHASRTEELEMLRELIAEDPSVLTRGNKRAARQWEVAEEVLDRDLVPSSDPNVASQLHRIMQATALATMAQQAPGVLDPKWVMKNVCQTIGKELPDEAFLPPQAAPSGPPPDPAKLALAQAQQQKNAILANDMQRKAAEAVTQSENDRQTAALKAQTDQAKLSSAERIAQVNQETERLRLGVEAAKAAHEAHLATQDQNMRHATAVAGILNQNQETQP